MSTFYALLFNQKGPYIHGQSGTINRLRTRYLLKSSYVPIIIVIIGLAILTMCRSVSAQQRKRDEITENPDYEKRKRVRNDVANAAT